MYLEMKMKQTRCDLCIWRWQYNNQETTKVITIVINKIRQRYLYVIN